MNAPAKLVAAVAALAVVLSAVLAFDGVDIPSAELLEGYRVAYRIEDRASADVAYRTQIVEVRRPYDGRIEDRSGPTTRGPITGGKISNRVFGWQLDDGGQLQFGLRRPPGGPTRDVSYSAVQDAVRAGLAEFVGVGEALGRRCVWFSFADPYPEAFKRPTDDSRVDACITPGGILMREIWTLDDRVVRAIEAVDVDEEASPRSRFLESRRPETTDVSQPEAANILKQQIVVGDDVGGRRPAMVLTAPRGWKRDRDAVVVQAADSGRPTQYSSISYLRGTELVVVDRALKPDYDELWVWTEGQSEELANAQRARILYHPDRVELRIALDEGFARVFAPDRATAIAFGRRLQPR